jgi:hypothetical protein
MSFERVSKSKSPSDQPLDLDEYFYPLKKPKITQFEEPTTVLCEWLNSQRKVERKEFYPQQLQKI